MLFRSKAPRRIFVYIAVILVYKATDTVADTERHEERHTAMCGFLYGVLRQELYSMLRIAVPSVLQPVPSWYQSG